MGTVDQRLRFVVLAGELEGPQAALLQLKVLEQRLQGRNLSLTPDQQLQFNILRKLYTDYAHWRYDAPSVTPTERAQLHEHLGWFGDLALAPAGQPGVRDEIIAAMGLPAATGVRSECPNPAAREEVLLPTRRVAIAIGLAVAGVLGFGFIGLVMLATLLFLLALGKVRGGLETGQTPAGVYAETFALWIMLFGGLTIGASLLPLGSWRLMASGLAMLLSLGVLLWPRLRGIPFQQLRRDIGWTLGRQPVLEPAAGLATYVMTMPMLIVGLLMVMLLTLAQNWMAGGGPGPDDFSAPSNPSHPIAIYLARGGWGMRLQIFFLASIVAPIVEETMFRGVLYHHLRELTRGVDTVASIMFSTLISCFIFAIIHPQGVLAVPALMALACGFVLAREWRGTLIPSMIAHGLNNGLVLLMGIVMLGD
jgi:membrane protease YdiL (CAAX protease family)